MFNAVLCKSCGNGIHGRCAKIKMVTNTLAIDIICGKSKGCHENVEDQKEKLHDDGNTVTDFSYLGDFIYLVGECEVAVTSRTRYGLAKCRDCQDILCGKIPQKIKGSGHKSCVRSAKLYGSETWCLGQN